MIQVNPATIPVGGPAKISTTSANTKVINISNGTDTVSITVPPNTVVDWTPPAGWTRAWFNDADGRCAEVFRYIQDAQEDGHQEDGHEGNA